MKSMDEGPLRKKFARLKKRQYQLKETNENPIKIEEQINRNNANFLSLRYVECWFNKDEELISASVRLYLDFVTPSLGARLKIFLFPNEELAKSFEMKVRYYFGKRLEQK